MPGFWTFVALLVIVPSYFLLGQSFFLMPYCGPLKGHELYRKDDPVYTSKKIERGPLFDQSSFKLIRLLGY